MIHPLTQTHAWKMLEIHYDSLRHTSIAELQNPERTLALVQSLGHLSVDFTNQRINETTLALLMDLARERQLPEKIQGLFRGDIVNPSEGKPALHTALRIQDEASILVSGKNVVGEILETRKRIEEISDAIRNGSWLGYTGKPITDIVNIGIGGSDFGPRFCLQALQEFTMKTLSYHFISDADPYAFSATVKKLNPETTLFIVVSKSFTTVETLYNAEKAFKWLGNTFHQQVIAVTARKDRAEARGITHILPVWDWVGGRFSACSAVNLMTAIAIGYQAFSQLLMGANHMDKHFLETDFRKNIPVLLALIGIWNNNFLGIHHLLVLTYAKQLEYFLPFIQQLDMESNGKSIDNESRAVNYATGPIIWGGLGNQAQHSYYQLLCQGTHKVTLDFITLASFENELVHTMYMAKKDILTNGFNDKNNPNGYIPGNAPLNHIRLNDCVPYTIGAFIALYEHKIYAQSVIWNINPFDQPGVESSKQKQLSFDVMLT